jgi:hypothetical protein
VQVIADLLGCLLFSLFSSDVNGVTDLDRLFGSTAAATSASGTGTAGTVIACGSSSLDLETDLDLDLDRRGDLDLDLGLCDLDLDLDLGFGLCDLLSTAGLSVRAFLAEGVSLLFPLSLGRFRLIMSFLKSEA